MKDFKFSDESLGSDFCSFLIKSHLYFSHNNGQKNLLNPAIWERVISREKIHFRTRVLARGHGFPYKLFFLIAHSSTYLPTYDFIPIFHTFLLDLTFFDVRWHVFCSSDYDMIVPNFDKEAFLVFRDA